MGFIAYRFAQTLSMFSQYRCGWLPGNYCLNDTNAFVTKVCITTAIQHMIRIFIDSTQFRN